MTSISISLDTCTECDLSKTRTQVVPGTGNTNATIALVGEAPGKDEDVQGVPFVGKAGKMLDWLIDQAGLHKYDLWITNRLKCRPPGNDLKSCPDAVVRCPELWLWGELRDLTNLKVVVALGLTAGSLWNMGKRAKDISQAARVTFYKEEGTRVIIGSYHPSFAMRPGNAWAQEEIVGSLKRAKELAG